MIGGGDERMTRAWPDLRRFCRERQVEVVEVDPRFRLRPFE
jgi:predicted membrane-bound spermidine synthase